MNLLSAVDTVTLHQPLHCQMQDNKANSPDVCNTVLTGFVDTWCYIKQNVHK